MTFLVIHERGNWSAIRLAKTIEEAKKELLKMVQEATVEWGDVFRISKGPKSRAAPISSKLLLILTMAADGNVPVAFRCTDGNASDAQTHIETWETLRDVPPPISGIAIERRTPTPRHQIA